MNDCKTYKARIVKEAKRVLKTKLPSPDILNEVETNIIRLFNGLSLQTIYERDDPETDIIFDYCRKKVAQVFLKLKKTYAVPKVFGQVIVKTVLLDETDSYSVTLDDLSDSDGEGTSEIKKGDKASQTDKPKSEGIEDSGKMNAYQSLKIAAMCIPVWDGSPSQKGAFIKNLEIVKTAADNDSEGAVLQVAINKITSEIIRAKCSTAKTINELISTLEREVQAEDPIVVLKELRSLKEGPEFKDRFKNLGNRLAEIYMGRGSDIEAARKFAADQMAQIVAEKTSSQGLRQAATYQRFNTPDEVMELINRDAPAPLSMAVSYQPYRRNFRGIFNNYRGGYRGRGFKNNFSSRGNKAGRYIRKRRGSWRNNNAMRSYTAITDEQQTSTFERPKNQWRSSQ